MRNFLTQRVHTILGALLLSSVALWAGMSIVNIAQSADAGEFAHLQVASTVDE